MSISAVAAYSPLSLSPALWLDGKDAATVTLVNSAVSQWADKSGNNRHAGQSNSAIRPTYTAGVGINFNNQGLTVATFPVIAGGTIFVVQQTTDTVYLMLTTELGQLYGWVAHENSASSIESGFGVPTYYNNGTRMFWGNRGDVYTALHNATNVISVPGIAMDSTWSTNFKIGQYVPADSMYSFQGILKELIIFPTVLSIEDRQKEEGRLAWKHGTVASLPVGHPYKSVAP